jgi:DNA repair metallo-beta-lactamase
MAPCVCTTCRRIYIRRLGASSVVGIVPTGWTYQIKNEDFPVHEKPPWKIHLVPYSEHSSYTELVELVGFLRPREIIPTVGVGAGGRGDDAASRRMLQHFRHLCDNTAAKRAFLGAMAGSAGGAVTLAGSATAKRRDEDTEAADPAVAVAVDVAVPSLLASATSKPPEQVAMPSAPAWLSQAADDNMDEAGCTTDMADGGATSAPRPKQQQEPKQTRAMDGSVERRPAALATPSSSRPQSQHRAPVTGTDEVRTPDMRCVLTLGCEHQHRSQPRQPSTSAGA